MRKSLIAIVFFLAAILVSGCVELYSLIDQGISDNSYFDNNPFANDDPFGQKSLTGGMHGTITDYKDNPLNDAVVSLVGDEFTYSDRTSKDGMYNISGVPAGEYDVVIKKEGYDDMTLPRFTIMEDYSYKWDVKLYPAYIPSSTGNLHGVVMDRKNASLEGAFVLLTSDVSSYNDSTDRNGEYNFTVPAGVYSVVVGKQGYTNLSTNLTIVAGHTYGPWNLTIGKDCIYYPMNTSVNYVVRYGYNGTIYKGDTTLEVNYPEGAGYSIYPASDGLISQLSTTYRAGNRMLTWKLDNTAGRYAYIQSYLFVDLKGTQTIQLFDKKEMTIPSASASLPAFLGSETPDDDGRAMIDPYSSEIRTIAEQVKRETGSDNVWTVAKAMFVWLKNNTYYYHGPESDVRTQSAIEVLRSGRGDCDELSTLYISLCRAIGIPTRFVKGYMVEKDPEDYISHEWVEFYDGEWVPVEVAGSGNITYENGVIRGEKGNITHILDTRFGISLPDHVTTFVDDGTSQSMNTGNEGGVYYDRPSEITYYNYYDSIEYDDMYLSSCADGTRTLVKERE